MTGRRVLVVLKNLLLAIINATLILLAVCLWLAWQLSETISSAATEFAEGLVTISPIREDIQGMTTELADLRAELSTIRTDSGEAASEAVNALQNRVIRLDQRVSGTLGKVETLVSKPEELIGFALDRASSNLETILSDAWQCRVGDAVIPTQTDG